MTKRKPRLAPPLKWHGGKHYLAPKIIALMPPHLHYVEPYAGGLAVLLEKDLYDPRHRWGEKSHEQGCSEVVNDVYLGLTNFWRVLQGERAFLRFRRITHQEITSGRIVSIFSVKDMGDEQWYAFLPALLHS